MSLTTYNVEPLAQGIELSISMTESNQLSMELQDSLNLINIQECVDIREEAVELEFKFKD